LVEVLQWSKEYLSAKGIESAQLEAEWLLREVLGYSRLQIYLHYDRPLSAEELTTFKKLLLERSSGKPLQYVLGYTEFMGIRLKVTPDVLIPRPETEQVVEQLIDLIRKQAWSLPRFADLCTGSGNIAIALAQHFPDAEVLAVDVSAEALSIAAENVQAAGVADQIRLVQQNILESDLRLAQPLHVLVSNPPYVGGEYFRRLPDAVKYYEPLIALNPGSDELAFYRRLSTLAVQVLAPGGIFAVEIGGSYQEKLVRELLEKQGLLDLTVVTDYQSQSRGIFARFKP
jgi:release factor glutamine methyltransferase